MYLNTITLSGAEITSANDDASFTKANRKQILIDTGTNVEAATKAGAGQIAHATSTTGGKKSSNYYVDNVTNQAWYPMMSAMLRDKNIGTFTPVSTTNSQNVTGIFIPTATTGTLSITAYDNNHGRAIAFTTGSVAGNQSGFRHDAFRFANRQHNPFLRFKFSCNETSNIRFFMGFIDSLSLVANSNDMLNAIAGFGVGVETTSSVFRIFHNDSAGATISDSTGITIDTSKHTVDLYADDTNSRFFWQMDEGAASGFVTTEIPGATSGLAFQATYTTTTGVARAWDCHQVLMIVTPA